jgi:hypothetical protein
MSQRFSRLDPTDALDCLRTDVVSSSAAAKDRVSMRLSASIAALPSASERKGEETDSPAESGEAQVEPPDALQAADGAKASASAGYGAAQVSGWLGALTRRPLAWSLVAFSAGAACGAGIHAIAAHRADPPAVSTHREARAVAAPIQQLEARSATSTEAASDPASRVVRATPIDLSPVASARNHEPTGGSRMASLAAQQALLDEARTALARGDAKAALRAIDQHTRRYPDSVMVEEREALSIKAFIASGNYAEARARSGRFRTRYPRSLLLPSIDEALSEIP